MSSPSADVSVRIAWADDAEAISRIQARAWASSYAALVPAAADLRPADFAQLWREALTRPADARHRALVALERNRVVGFAITTPATDPDTDPARDGELMEFTVDEGAQQVAGMAAHAHAALKASRNMPRPRWMRLRTVPTGISSARPISW